MRIIRNTIVAAAIIVIIASVILNSIYFIINILPNKNKLFSAAAAELLQQPVQIKQAQIEGYWWQPVVVLHDATVGRMHLRELQISLDLWKMITQKKWVTDQIAIDYLQLRVEEDAKNNILISGLSSNAIALPKNSALMKNIIAWIKIQPEIIFSNAQIDIVKNKGARLTINHLDMLIKNHHNKHIVSARLQLQQTMPTQVRFIASDTNNRIKIFLQGNHVQVSQWIPWLSRFHDLKKITPAQGLFNFKSWITLDHHQWQQVQSQFSATHVSLGDFKINSFSGELNVTPTRGALLIFEKNTKIISMSGNVSDSDTQVTLQGYLNPAQLSQKFNFSFLRLFKHNVRFYAEFSLPDSSLHHFPNIDISLGDLYFLNQHWNELHLIANFNNSAVTIHFNITRH